MHLSQLAKVTIDRATSIIGANVSDEWKRGIASTSFNILSSLRFCCSASRTPFTAQCGYFAACNNGLAYARLFILTSAIFAVSHYQPMNYYQHDPKCYQFIILHYISMKNPFPLKSGLESLNYVTNPHISKYKRTYMGWRILRIHTPCLVIAHFSSLLAWSVGHCHNATAVQR